ncbi:sialate O-acetylesterase [Granulosicoccus antarcticus]|uniref:Exoglucanase B n=1 Tax=Granulosicoccus antarcticus IMCC3135 TaxID=1192854 RepID=A0A2Z2P364_9GAMM|nr:sialate O-acetylesterase [Granulosicoccus antarcticus]ASJ75840.1 Exoglucanase B [Granulosicoccus antarcticus IMCC3135]
MPSFSLARFSLLLSLISSLWLMPALSLQAAGLAPAAPGNLIGDIDAGVASLSWDVPSDDDVIEGYNIYINDRYTNTVFSNSYSTAVQPDTLYSFKVVAFDTAPRRFSPASASLTLPASLVPDDLTIPPSVPTDLTGDVTGTTVSIAWQPSTDDEAVLGYNVYRDNKYLTTVRTPAYSGDNAAGESHSWYVVAFDIRTNFSARSGRITLPDPGPVDTTIAPSVPTDLTGSMASGNPSDTVTVNWQAATDDQAVAGYNIYRNRQYIATRFGTEYIGTVDTGSSNNFTVVAFDFDGNFSASSKAITLPLGTAETNPGKPPSVPTDLAGETSNSNGQTQVQLSWTASTSTVKVAGYNIYRNNDYRTTVFTNAYTDTVPAGSAFSYKVVAFDSFGNFSAKSAPLSLLGDANQPPFFSDLDDQNLTVGEDWELVLRPVDVDGGAAGILISSPPAGVQFIDNRNGSRSLTWTPGPDDVGSHDITITAFDLQETDLRTSQTITLTVTDDAQPVDAPFSVSIAQAAYNLQEGNASGVNIPVSLTRDAGFEGPVTLTLSASNSDDEQGLTSTFTLDTLQAGDTQSTLNLALAVDVLPILSQQRRYSIVASDGTFTATSSVTVAVTPVALDDVYLIMGQSNAVGFSEDDAKQAGAGGLDQINLRIRQANVQSNDSKLYVSPASYTDSSFNFRTPAFVSAEDPLHEPVDPSTLAKEGTRIGMGLSFAKSALPNTSRNIILVPAAWAGSAFCNTELPAAHWNALQGTQPELGNTLLFDRALARVNETLRASGGILRGILWHQGESDSTAECAPLYEDNLVTLVSQLRSRIAVDARGEDARGPDANIPFVLGTMSKGNDARGDLSDFTPEKQIVDSVHRNIASLVPHADVVLTDDLTPSNSYPCGEASCIHFGADALREMGVRSFDALVRAGSQ